MDKLIWTLGNMENFIDNFRNPMDAPPKIYDIDLNENEKWPGFHVSCADPDGGYKDYEYGISFKLNNYEGKTFKLKIHYIITTPRVPYLEIDINGYKGYGYLNSNPYNTEFMRPKHALHSSIYNKGVLEINIPSDYLKDKNVLKLTAKDSSPKDKITNYEEILRLDRMADACGFWYDEVSFFQISDLKKLVVKIEPSPFYKNIQGELKYKVTSNFNILKGKKINGFIKLISNEEIIFNENFNVENFTLGEILKEFYVKDSDGKVDYIVNLNIDGEDKIFKGSFEVPKKFKIFCVPHVHTDIGYTHRQWEVSERLSRNLDKVLEILNHNDEFKEKNGYMPFAYMLDSAWTIDNYINSRSDEKVLELFKRIKQGYIGVCSNYAVHINQFCSLEDLIRDGDFSYRELKKWDLKPECAVVVDVDSVSMSMATVLSKRGVKYLIHANNQDRGPFRINGDIAKYSPFYYEGPDGSKVLYNLSRMYCEIKKVCGSPMDVVSAERGLLMWIKNFSHEDYVYDAILMFGQDADNTDIDPSSPEFIKKWNEEFEFPKLIPSTGVSFFKYIEENFKEKIKTIKGDEGSFWEDGIQSTMKPSYMVREAQMNLKSAEILESLSVIENPSRKFRFDIYKEAWKNIILFDEHTWGAFSSGHDPESLLAKDQWEVKENFAVQSYLLSKNLLHSSATIHSLNLDTNGREIVVFNTNSWAMTSSATVEISLDEVIKDSEKKDVPSFEKKRNKQTKIVEFLVKDLPEFSLRRYFLIKENIKDEDFEFKNILENKYYKVVVDFENGEIKGIFDKCINKDICKSEGFGKFIYASGGENTRLEGNHYDKKIEEPKILKTFNLKNRYFKETLLKQTIALEADVHNGTLKMEISLYNFEKKLKIDYCYDKKEVQNVEAVYIAFPSSFENGKVLYDSQIGYVDLEKDLIKGACTEWFPLQTSMIIEEDRNYIQIASKEVPLFIASDIVKGTWNNKLVKFNGKLYSYVLNNYWRTNYKGSQGGKLYFSYSITSGEKPSKGEYYKFGFSERNKIYAQRISLQKNRNEVEFYNFKNEIKFVDFSSKNSQISTIYPNNTGYIVRIIETNGEKGFANLSFTNKKILKAFICDLNDEIIDEINPVNGEISIDINPWEIKNIKISFS